MQQNEDLEQNEDFEKEISEIFKYFDNDNNGYMDLKEFTKACSLVNQDMPDEEAKQYMQDFDRDGDGYVSFAEFKRVMMERREQYGDGSDQLNDALDCFLNSYDTNKDGTINKTEFRKFLQNCGQRPLSKDDVDEMFNDLDANGDRQLDKEELIKLFTKPTAEF